MVKDKSNLWGYTLLLFILFVGNRTLKMNIQTLYDGIPFQGTILFYGLYILFFFGFSLYIFGDSEHYFSNYGIYTLMRYRKKECVYYNYLVLLIGKIVIYDLLKVLLCIALTAMFFENIELDTEHIIFLFAVNILIDSVLGIMQTILEISFNSRWALCIMGVYYIISVVICDILYMYDIRYIPFILFPNWGMGYRIDMIDFSYFRIAVSLMIILALLAGAGKCIIKRKEFL